MAAAEGAARPSIEEMTMPQLLTESPDFRTYQPEVVTGPTGEDITLQLCEELVDGRWEPFYSLRKSFTVVERSTEDRKPVLTTILKEGSEDVAVSVAAGRLTNLARRGFDQLSGNYVSGVTCRNECGDERVVEIRPLP
jgi:hypothetical protein